MSRTDADARLLSKNGQVVAGYNVQVAVDDKDKLIAASEIVNDGNDSGQLYTMVKTAKEELAVQTLRALADTGYLNGNALKDCEENGSSPTVRTPSEASGWRGRLSHEELIYDAAADTYRYPARALLPPSNGRKVNAGRIEIRYTSRKADCDALPFALPLSLGQDADA